MPRAASRAVTAVIAIGLPLLAVWGAPAMAQTPPTEQTPTTAQAPSTQATTSSRTPPVRVQVLGLEGELKRNVLASLTIRKRSERRGLSEMGVRQLHTRAENEIRRALEPYGFYRPMIQAELATERRPWIARYTITPGPAIRLDSVRVVVTGEGAGDPGYQRRVAAFPLRPGDVLDHQAYARGKTALESYAAEGGYLDARLLENRIHVDLERYAAAIVLRIDSGHQHRFGETRFEQDVLNDKVVARFVNYRPGDVLDYRKLMELQTDLSETGYFSRVEVELRRDEERDDTVPVEVTLAASGRERYTGGVGYGTDDGARVTAAAELRRLNKNGHRARIEGQLSQIEQTLAGQYLVPWPNPRTDLITFTAGTEDQKTTVSNTRAFRAGTGLARTLGRWDAAVALNYRRDDFTVGPDIGITQFLIPAGTWSRVRTDNMVVTRGGDRVRIDLRGAQEGLLSDASLLQSQVDGKLIYGLGGRFRALGRLQVGATATSQFRELPPTLRFFAGGSNSVRGYSYQSLGPRDETGSVVGGEHLLVTSLEMNGLVLPRWGLAVFYDVGNALHTFHLPSLKRGVGTGVRWWSPFGLIRADVAWGLDRTGDPIEVHLMVGPEL